MNLMFLMNSARPRSDFIYTKNSAIYRQANRKLVTEKARQISPVAQRVTEKDRRIWPVSQHVTFEMSFKTHFNHTFKCIF